MEKYIRAEFRIEMYVSTQRAAIQVFRRSFERYRIDSLLHAWYVQRLPDRPCTTPFVSHDRISSMESTTVLPRIHYTPPHRSQVSDDLGERSDDRVDSTGKGRVRIRPEQTSTARSARSKASRSLT